VKRRRQAWAPEPPAGEFQFFEDFPSQILGNSRRVVVYLPPGYSAEAKRRHPVVYLHDGQNVFDPATAAHGVSWQAHRTADRLLAAGRIPPLILVGICNTPGRTDEYTVHFDRTEQAGGRGRDYGRFLAHELKPVIDATYRTRPGREHTAVVGSSLGGLVSLTIARDHAGQFGLCGALSPSLWWCGGRLLREWAADCGWARGTRFWLDMGTREGGRGSGFPEGIGPARRLAACFDAAGLVPGRDYYYTEVAGGEHDEAAWAARLDKVLLYFFGATPAARPPGS